jgi:hypothetical protein
MSKQTTAQQRKDKKMKKNSLLLLVAFCLVLVGSALAATKNSSKTYSRTMRAAGEIVSINDTQVVVSAKNAGKSEDMTFMINPQTQKSSPLNTGEHVTVRYKDENGQKVATRISANQNAAAKTTTHHASKQKTS